MAKFTLLELHVDGTEISPKNPFKRGSGDSGGDGGTDIEVREGSSKRGRGRGSWKAALVGLLFLLVVAAVAKRKMGGDESVPELDDFE